MNLRWAKMIAVGCIAVMMASCAHHKKSDKAEKHEVVPFHQERPAEVLFREAEEALATGFYSSAAKKFETLQISYPYFEKSEQVNKDIIFAYYQKDDMAAAVAAADRFIQLYSTSDYLPYVYYMRGLANFKQDRGILSRLIPVDASKRAPGTMKDAFKDFEVVVTQYPESIYAPDARQHMIYIRNFLAQAEINTAQFYMKRKAYVAAVNRANYVLAHFSETPQTRLARKILIKAYTALQMPDMAEKARNLG